MKKLLFLSILCAANVSFGLDNNALNKEIEAIRAQRSQIMAIYNSIPDSVRGYSNGFLDVEKGLYQIEADLTKLALTQQPLTNSNSNVNGVDWSRYGFPTNTVPNVPGYTCTPNTPTPIQPAQPPQDVPNGMFCQAACKDYNGNPDLKYVKGAYGDFEAQAKENALQAVRSAYSCNYGIVNTQCSPQYSSEKFYCASSCTDYNGNADQKYTKSASAKSLVEAMTKATSTLNTSYSCNYGVKSLGCTDHVEKNYCVAACKDYNGNADLNYSKGEAGNSKLEAQVKAISDVNSAFSCNYGVIVTECSTQ